MTQRPDPSFLLIVQIHHLHAMLRLGMLPNPSTGQPEQPDVDAARHEMELLKILEEKTKGNLTEEEAEILSEAIATLRTNIEE